MADNDISFIMRIRSIFEGKGHADAIKNVEDLGKKGKEAGESGAAGMNVMSTATAAMNGNISGVASGLTGLIGKVKLLGMSMMQLSLVAAVLTTLVKLFQAIAERADQMAQNLRAIQSGNVTAAVERITASYAKMREETERAQKSRDALFDVNMQELEAVKKLELAQIQLNKQRLALTHPRPHSQPPVLVPTSPVLWSTPTLPLHQPLPWVFLTRRGLVLQVWKLQRAVIKRSNLWAVAKA
jgi:hypothetical protein